MLSIYLQYYFMYLVSWIFNMYVRVFKVSVSYKYLVYVCVYVCMYVCMYVCVYSMYVCMCVCMYVCMHVCMYEYIYVCMYACIYMYDGYVCMWVCMYDGYVCMMGMYVCGCVLYFSASPERPTTRSSVSCGRSRPHMRLMAMAV
jgi:hypothetical protein